MEPNRFLQFILGSLLLFFVSNTFAQSKLTGVVVDGSDQAKLAKATVTLLSPKDSIVQKFTWTQDNGSFSISALDTGKYKVIIAYPQYADVVKDIHHGINETVLGTIKLSKAALLIDEVLVNRSAPIVIKGDTLEYDAASFKVDKDAKVEDLLKVLPGITVDANGKITAQGKEVKKVLLDGEEFFGDDPALITKNIRSDMVDKVQVYEKKSDLAVRTGVDDGERTQTIDIKLKQDKKKGMFGQALGGVGTDKYYAGKVMANQFNGPRKIAFYGVTANDGLVGLGFEDNQTYGMGSSNLQMTDEGYYMISGSGGDEGDSWSGKYQGNGIPSALNFGISYSDKIKGDKHKINVNYRRNQMEVENNTTYSAQDNFPGQARLDNSSTFSDRENRSNVANIRYDMKVDSMTDMTLQLGINKSKGDNFSKTFGAQQEIDSTLINQMEQRNRSENNSERFTSSFMLTRRFKKDRRSLTMNAIFGNNEQKTTSKFYSYTFIVEESKELLVDQLKNNSNTNQNFGATLTYTEPLSKRLTGSLGYTFGNNKMDYLDQSFKINDATGIYDKLDYAVLNDFNNNTLSNTINTGLNYKSEKIVANVSNRLVFDNVSRLYNNLGTELERDQTSFNPNVSFLYNFNKYKSVRINYNGSTRQPSLNELEPLKQNSQQLITYLDNLDLKSSFSNRYSVSFNNYNALKQKSVYAYLFINQTNRNIGS